MKSAVDTAFGPIAEELLSLVADAVITTDESGGIILVNKAAEQIFGYEAHELLGKKIEVLMPPRYRASHLAEVRQFGSAKSTFSQVMARGRDVVGLDKNGREFPIEASLTRHELVGRLLLTVVLRDISERRQSEEVRRLIVS